MKKYNKKIIVLVVLILLIIGTIIGINLLNKDENYSLSLNENKWIDTNKHNVIDVCLLNEIAGISYDGEGVFFDYLSSLEEKNNIKTNVIPYKLDEDMSSCNFKTDIKSKPTTSDLTLLKSNMILVMKDKTTYNTIKDIKGITIGILASDKASVEPILKDNNITYVTYEKYSDLKKSILEENDKGVKGIIILKDLFTREIMEHEFNVSYEFSDLSKYITISLNGDKTLNSIFYKTYSNWAKTSLEESYTSYLLSSYYKFKNVSDANQKSIKSKSYVYGFIEDGIFNLLDNKQITGINGLLLKDFNKFSNVSITYTKYNSIKNLIEDFNNKKIDFVFSNVSGYDNSTIYETVRTINRKLVVVSSNSNDIVVTDLKSLKNKDVSVIKNSKLEEELKSLGIKVKAYNNMSDLVKGYTSSDIVVLDIENYNYYKTTTFKDSKIDYINDDTDSYNYIINNTSDNKEFISLFNFYLNYFNSKSLVVNNYETIAYENSNMIYILIIILIILVAYVIIDSTNHMKVMFKTVKTRKKTRLTKEEKLKYIDQLTSLKNRAYLNSKIEEWDDSEVYPQAIIIIDLNNVSYVNDNYGREEGDKIITEAANVLIMNQLQNSEIIRTDGNEFLIYLVGYSEKQIVAYLRKLNKQLKGLSHGFGCASGYSIITDAIKTIDDAVNEATIDMKNNKEEIDY